MDSILPQGFKSLVHTIQNLQPDISEDEALIVADRIAQETGRRLANGEQLAFLNSLPDGSIDVTVIQHFLKNKNSE